MILRKVRALYDWVIKWATTPYAQAALFFIALAEASFFPIPPDVLLIPMAVALPKHALRYAVICTVGSTLGGVLGYMIGAFLMDSVGMAIVNFYTAGDAFSELKQAYNDNAILAIAVSGFTPIPYKIFSVSSGAFGVPLSTFIVTSAISRGARFFLVAGLIRLFGARIKDFIDRYFNLLTLVFSAILILGFVVVKWLF